MRWRIYRESSGETLFWWPYQNGFNYPTGMAFDALLAVELTLHKASWYLGNVRNLDNIPPFSITLDPVHGFIKIEDSVYRWELENA